MVTIAHDKYVDMPETFRFSRERFYRALETGFFEETDKVELISGELVTEGMLDRMLQKSPHAVAVLLVAKALSSRIPPGYHVRSQLPLSLGVDHEVEPDCVVVSGRERDYTAGHPTTAELIVEVSESTLRFDQTFKSSLYAANGIPEYWIVNLMEQVLEVRRNPRADSKAQFGFQYHSVARIKSGESVAPSLAPGVQVAISDLLP